MAPVAAMRSHVLANLARPATSFSQVSRRFATASRATDRSSSAAKLGAAPSSAAHQPRSVFSSRFQQLQRRGYAESGPQANLSPTPKKKKAGFFRWTWRFTQLGLVLGVGYVSYTIYRLRNPADQLPPDPSKKTLVVLGTGWGSVSLLKSLDTAGYNRSIMEPIRHFLRHKRASVRYFEAEATKIDPVRKVIHIDDESAVKGDSSSTEVSYDYLVVGVGAENATFGIPGVREHSCFLKEVSDAQNIRKRIMDCCETATFKDQPLDEVKRLLHMVVVGGGPTGVEFAGELQDFFEHDLKKWIPEIAEHFKVTLVEALPNVLPSFSKQLIDYTEKTFQEETIEVRTKTAVKEVSDKFITAEYTDPSGKKIKETIPYGLLVWATGNALRPLVKDLMTQIPEQKDSRRGLAVNENLRVNGTTDIWAVGDCAVANYAPTAQVAAQEGAFLARYFNNLARSETIEEELAALSTKQATAATTEERNGYFGQIEELQKRLRRTKHVGPFKYSHQGSLAYIGSERAVADVSWMSGNFATGGTMTYLFWRSAYLSMVFSTRNKILVIVDWVKTKLFGRDVSRE